MILWVFIFILVNINVGGNMTINSRRILNRSLEGMKTAGCEFSKLNEYFGYRNTDNHVVKIFLERDPNLVNIFTLTIIQKTLVNPFQTYVKELPRDMNNEIYSFLSVRRELKYVLEIPSDFPFQPLNWSLISFKENDISKMETGISPNEMWCNDFSPAMTFEGQIRTYLSTLPWLHDDS